MKLVKNIFFEQCAIVECLLGRTNFGRISQIAT